VSISSFPLHVLSQEYMSLLTAGARALAGRPRGIGALAVCVVCGAARAFLRVRQLDVMGAGVTCSAGDSISGRSLLDLQRRGVDLQWHGGEAAALADSAMSFAW